MATYYVQVRGNKAWTTMYITSQRRLAEYLYQKFIECNFQCRIPTKTMLLRKFGKKALDEAENTKKRDQTFIQEWVEDYFNDNEDYGVFSYNIPASLHFLIKAEAEKHKTSISEVMRNILHNHFYENFK